MKQKIYYVGIVSVMVIFIAVFFKLNHYPGANIALTAGIAAFTLLFLPMALISNYKAEGNRHNRILYIVAWITSLVIFTGMLFKILHWTGAELLLLIGIPMPFVVFLPVYLYITSAKRNYSIYHTAIVLLLLMALSIFNAFLAVGVSFNSLYSSVGIAKQYNTVNKMLVPAITDRDENVNMGIINRKADELLLLISEARALLLSEVELESQQWPYDAFKSRQLDSRTVVSTVLFSDKEPHLAAMIETATNEFLQSLAEDEAYTVALQATLRLFENNREEGGDEYNREHLFSPDNYLSWTLIRLDEMTMNVNIIKATLPLYH